MKLMARVQETGFSVGTGVLPLLGLDISLDGNQDEKRIWDPVLRKLNGTIFKSRALNLPLGGKVAVVKTFCLSSIAYTARMVTLPTFYRDKISDYITSFINSGVVGLVRKSFLGGQSPIGVDVYRSLKREEVKQQVPLPQGMG